MLHLRRIHLNACDFYVALGCLYYLQDVIYPSGIINQLIQLLMMLWALVVSLRYLFNFTHTPRLLNVVSLLVAMYTIYGSALILFSPEITINEGNMMRAVKPYTYMQNAFNSLLPFYLFYSFAKQGKLTSKRIYVYCIIFFFLFIAMYFKLQQQLLIQAAIDGIEREEFTNNTGYEFIILIPLLFFLKNRLLRYAMLIAVMFFTIICMKRGAILIGGLACVCSIRWLK